MRILSGFVICLLLTATVPAQNATPHATPGQTGTSSGDAPTFQQVQQRAMANTQARPGNALAEPAPQHERRMSPRIWTMIGIAAAGTAAGIWAANRGNGSKGNTAFNVSAGNPVVTGPR